MLDDIIMFQVSRPFSNFGMPMSERVLIPASPAVDYLPFKPSLCTKASFYISENRLIFPTAKGF